MRFPVAHINHCQPNKTNMKELDQKRVILKNPARPIEERALGSLTSLINTGDIVIGDGDLSQFTNPQDPIPTRSEQRSETTAPKPTAPVSPHPSSSNEAEDEGLPLPPAREVGVPDTIAKKDMPERVFLTGRLRSGKDNALERLGYTMQSFAEPLYALQEMFFGTRDKSLSGAREFLQTVGQWGRGEINEQYRLTPARATFIILIRSLAAAKQLPDLGVDWKNFGQENLWIDALLRRVGPGTTEKVGVSNVRFDNEYSRMTESGWTHYHVMCSPQTWTKRLAKSGMNPKSPSLNDLSERLAIGLDADVYSRIKLKPTGGKLRVIWNDDDVKPPSPRLYTLTELYQ